MRNISGIYGANIPRWPNKLWGLVGLGNFNWAVVRTDCDPAVAKELRKRGINVILQLPDGFNQDPHINPADWVQRCLYAAFKFRGLSNIICLDNEPNLCQQGDSKWFAEQFCRWYRAVIALWRFHDPGGWWRVLFPALSPTISLLPQIWLEVNRENLDEADAVASHSYWPDATPPNLVHLDALHRVIHAWYPDKDIHILEYGSPSTKVDDASKALGYAMFLDGLPAYVKSACVFILGGTSEWSDWFLTEKIALTLGQL